MTMNRCTFLRGVIPSLLLLFVLLFSIPDAAQAEAPMSQAEVAKLLERIEVTFLDTTSLGTSFEQEKQISFFDGTIKSTGALLFQHPDKVRMDSFTPFRTSAVVNGDTAIQYEFVNGRWTKLDTATNRMLHAVMKNIISWLQGRFNDASLYGVTGVMKSDQPYLTLTPKSPEYQKHIHHFELGINKAVNGLDSILIMLPDGDYTRYTFYNDRINGTLPSEIFNTQGKEPSVLPSWLTPAP